MISHTVSYTGSPRIPLPEMENFIEKVRAAFQPSDPVIINVTYSSAGRDPRESDAVTMTASSR